MPENPHDVVPKLTPHKLSWQGLSAIIVICVTVGGTGWKIARSLVTREDLRDLSGQITTQGAKVLTAANNAESARQTSEETSARVTKLEETSAKKMARVEQKLNAVLRSLGPGGARPRRAEEDP